jgi:DNA-binding IscR family transcriptional regulator
MRKLNAKQAEEIPIGDVVAVINGGIQLVDAAAPVLSILFNKVNDWITQLGKNNPNSPKNVRLRLAALEAKDALQKELNKTFEARLAALENK